MSRAGAEVVVSARDADRLNELVGELPGRAVAAPLDVTDAGAVARVAEEIGPVDGMVYLAGLYWPMKAQEWNADDADAMAMVNFIGAQRCVGAVVPGMVARDAGHIVLTGSLAGFRGLPGAIGYGASKAAVMHLAENLQIDLAKTGVDVQLVNPGFIKTRLTDKNEFTMPFIMEPEAAAQEIFEHMNSTRFAKSFPALFSLFFRLGRVLPEWLQLRLFARS